MKGRSVKGRQKPTAVKRPRVFVTPGSPKRAPGGVYARSGKPMSTPGGGSAFPSVPGEIDDWIPEPESYLPEDEDFQDFEVSSGSENLSMDGVSFEDVQDWGPEDDSDTEMNDVPGEVEEEDTQPFQETPASEVPDLIPAKEGHAESERSVAPVMAPTNPGLDGTMPSFIGEEPKSPVPMRIASGSNVRWKK